MGPHDRAPIAGRMIAARRIREVDITTARQMHRRSRNLQPRRKTVRRDRMIGRVDAVLLRMRLRGPVPLRRRRTVAGPPTAFPGAVRGLRHRRRVRRSRRPRARQTRLRRCQTTGRDGVVHPRLRPGGLDPQRKRQTAADHQPSGPTGKILEAMRRDVRENWRQPTKRTLREAADRAVRRSGLRESIEPTVRWFNATRTGARFLSRLRAAKQRGLILADT